MKRIIFLLFFVSPFFALAQQPYARYCPDTKQIFTGVASDYGGHPKIELAVDPVFNEQMKRERFTPDLPVAPIYDLVVTVVPHINEYCLPQYDENGALIKKIDPPKTLPFAASIELAGKALTSVSSLSWNGKKDDVGLPIYEWKIKGWKDGIVSESKMERLIRAVHDNNPSLKLVVQAKLSDGTRIREEKSPGFALCVPLWGSGTHQVVYDRVAHRLSDFIYQSDSIVSQGFLKVDPFKAYQKEFAHFFNLRNYQNYQTPGWLNIHEAAKNGALPLAQDCGDDKAIHIFISPLVPLDDFASALTGGRFIQVASDVTKRILNFNARDLPGKYFFNLPLPLIALHEFAHSFAGLSDEYLVFGPGVTGATNKNCSTNPVYEWIYKGRRYGDSNFEGCHYTDGSYRPSQKSIMRGAQSGETRFNVVSCGYIIAAVKGGAGPEYWPECINPVWNTIQPNEKNASLRNIFASLFQIFSTDKNLATIGGAGEGGQEILIEHISADGTFTGEVLSVPTIAYSTPPLVEVSDDEEETNVPPVSNTQPPQACGDSNGDGRVTTLDIALMRKHILGLGLLNADSIDRADINRDGVVSTLDIALLRRKILGDGSFPFSCSAVPFDLDAASFEALDTNQQSPSNLSDVSPDSIFDTVSVDLKVNGQDGPIEVEKRDRIVLSWISEGATRCRGVWQKNDIKLSGTAAGRITRPVTVKIACINADGERADDEVRVNVTD